MNPKITFDNFLYSFENIVFPEEPECIRKGQSLMNYLSRIWFEEYKRLSSANYYSEINIDCFYRDDLIPNTLKHLKEVWA